MSSRDVASRLLWPLGAGVLLAQGGKICVIVVAGSKLLCVCSPPKRNAEA